MKENWILFIGGVYKESSMLDSTAISPASNRWQKGFIGGMKNQGLNTIILSQS